MKLYIPSIGDQISLTEDWTFTLHCEYRNKTLFEFFSKPYIDDYHLRSRGNIQLTLPKNTILTIDRIYIRKGSRQFDSVSFILHQNTFNKKQKGRVRFWAKLQDVNNIHFVPNENRI